MKNLIISDGAQLKLTDYGFLTTGSINPGWAIYITNDPTNPSGKRWFFSGVSSKGYSFGRSVFAKTYSDVKSAKCVLTRLKKYFPEKHFSLQLF